MARRKRAFLDDSDPDSSEGSEGEDGFMPENEDGDARAEREMFEDPYHRKKRRRAGADDEDDEDEGFGGRRGGLGSKPRVNMNK